MATEADVKTPEQSHSEEKLHNQNPEHRNPNPSKDCELAPPRSALSHQNGSKAAAEAPTPKSKPKPGRNSRTEDKRRRKLNNKNGPETQPPRYAQHQLTSSVQSRSAHVLSTHRSKAFRLPVCLPEEQNVELRVARGKNSYSDFSPR
ncbi:unnamed protein product [Calypogeia fissa]